jgi:hypothetical protein
VNAAMMVATEWSGVGWNDGPFLFGSGVVGKRAGSVTSFHDWEVDGLMCQMRKSRERG